MDVSVDDHRHHGLACEAHARGAARNANVRGRACMCDFRAVHNQSRVIDHASVAYDQPRAFKHCDRLRGGRDRASGKETKGNDYRHCDYIRSVHGNLHHLSMRSNID
jgi:hypothetical protein